MNSAKSSAAGPGANLTALRGHNAALVLGLLRDAGDGGVSRLELAAHTGLTPQAVSKITARLRADGLAAEAGHRASTGGKPRTVLRLVPGARRAIGLHLDRDELTAVLVDLAGAPLGLRTVPFDFGAGAKEAVAVAGGEVEALLAEAGGGRDGLLGAGVAAPGPLDHGSGVLRRVTGFPRWDGFPLRDALAERLGLPVVLDKDTNAAALGLTVGGARQRAAGSFPAGAFAYLHLGTGLGAGLVLGGTVHRGARTGAGEFGHQVIQLDGPPCGCGNHGCLEALCLAAVADGDPARAARLLGVGAANLVRLLDIDRVLLGGRVVLAAPEPYARGVAETLAADAARSGGRTVPVEVVGRGGRAVVEGAAQLVLAPLFAVG
ncbi:ROK family transcriptional regulator [Streptomyces sp. ME19-01-6]|uniref:ROK family transcriptional regulator n=1 Tax=Streptomyces sp. ME19-01-6 TaxID=3028686 RepID=UPI0029B95D8C|nr:ROK family transcriptional regulator [Streptomyces sp. ME19-01-6]MDX3233258.1 ROK family transcriptional regulator [Streptomyces sp. ME19-01-6]